MSKRDIMWIDVETTGLSPEVHQITEVAAILTTHEGEELGRFQAALPRDNAVWENEALIMAGESGVIFEVATHTRANTVKGLLQLVAERSTEDLPLLGGIGPHFDREFLRALFKGQPAELNQLVHYRHMDVRTLAEFYKDCGIDVNFKRRHRAILDIEDTVTVYKTLKQVMRAALKGSGMIIEQVHPETDAESIPYEQWQGE